MIEEIMTKNIIVGSIFNTIEEIANLMKNNDIGFIPISKENKIIGVITDRDIIVLAISNNISASSLVENYITTGLITIDINNTIDSALLHMKNNKIKRLLVTKNNTVEGILSLSDIINHINDNSEIIDTLRTIFEIKKIGIHKDPEIDEFYL